MYLSLLMLWLYVEHFINMEPKHEVTHRSNNLQVFFWRMKVHLQLMKDELDCYNRGIDTSLLLHTLDGTPLLQDLQIMLAQVCGFGKTLSSFKMVYK